MAVQNLTYAEANEMCPVRTSNRFELLSTTKDYPEIEDSYAEQLGQKPAEPLFVQWRKTNETRQPVTAAVKTYPETKKPAGKGAKRSKQDSSTQGTRSRDSSTMREKPETQPNGVALNNTEKVTEKEKWESIIRDAAAKAARQKIKEGIINSYVEFVDQGDISEKIKRKFQACFKKHVDLSDVIFSECQNKSQSSV